MMNKGDVYTSNKDGHQVVIDSVINGIVRATTEQRFFTGKVEETVVDFNAEYLESKKMSEQTEVESVISSLEKTINEASFSLNEARDKLKYINEPKRFEPEITNETYNEFYCVSESGEINIYSTMHKSHSFMPKLRAYGACKATLKQAEKAAAKAKVENLLTAWALVLNDGWVPDWDNESELKHCIHVRNGRINTNDFTYMNFGVPVFKTVEARDKAIKEVGKDLIIKAWGNE